ncbi:AraC family transcriptional regulator (plasmid) [Rhizobium sp. CB3060]|uniref:AraC family transcriptional regulator n=1 Tax=Rhizobium sp. CB3060 TaxID=3138255 RepID=UPI0021A27FD7|nr:AraC family transcriptional regulator [Rhizobium tropici]UWU26079.1 AraC family transcriptional regulator [Rhizobium tropici]
MSGNKLVKPIKESSWPLATGSPLFSETAYRGANPDELSEMMSSSASPIKIRTQEGEPLAFRGRFVSAGGITLADCIYEGTIVAEREVPSEKLLVFLPTEGAASFELGQKQIVSAPGQATILEGPATSGIARITGIRHHLGLFIDRAKIVDLLENLLERPVKKDFKFHPHVDIADGPGFLLAKIVGDLNSYFQTNGLAQSSPLAIHSLCYAAISILLETCPNSYSDDLANPGPAPLPRHVKRAIEFMHEHLHEEISLTDIALAAMVSIRSLQEGFRQFRNTTPLLYLREIRLAGAHQELLEGDPETGVADIARKWSFHHLGRFAITYRRRFGELPSQTRKR